MTRAWLWVVVTVLSGCPPNPCGDASAERIAPDPQPLGLTGSAVRHTVSLANCVTGITGATARVTDASGRLVASEVISQAGVQAIVAFTPTSAGVHTVVVQFEPARGEASAPVVVLRDRSSEPPLLQFRATLPCSEVRVMHDVALCRGPSSSELIWGGTVVERNDFAMGLETPNALWGLRSDGVTRWTEEDAGLTSSSFPLNLRSATLAVSAASDERLLLGEGGLLFDLHTGADGGLERSPQPWAADPMMTQGLAVMDGGVLWLTGTEACFAAPSETKQCREWPLRMLAPQGDALWVMNDALGEVGFVRFGNGPVPLETRYLRLETEAKQQLVVAPTGYPTLRFGAYLVAIDGETLRLDAWRGPQGWDAGGVSERHVWFGNGTQVTVYAR